MSHEIGSIGLKQILQCLLEEKVELKIPKNLTHKYGTNLLLLINRINVILKFCYSENIR